MVQLCTIQVYQCTQCHNSEKVHFIMHFCHVQLQCISVTEKFWYKVYIRIFLWLERCSLFNLLTSIICTHPAPTAQVSNVKVERVNNNRAALVSWTPLTLHQARGFPVYFVTYQPSLQVGRVVCTVNTVGTNDSSVVIGDLDPTTEYTISVNVGTAGGKLRSSLAAGQSMLHQWPTYMLPMLLTRLSLSITYVRMVLTVMVMVSVCLAFICFIVYLYISIVSVFGAPKAPLYCFQK